MQSLIEYLVKALVDEPDKVIGKQGRIANALRTVVKSVAMKDKRKVYVEIIA